MIITILSGKGGTGKTTVSTNLALSLKNVQLLDADVEEPDSYIFIKPEFGDDYQPVTTNVPVIDEDKCTQCRKCVEFCEYNALSLMLDKVLVYPELCHNCGGCKRVCPTGAITEKEREIGQINQAEVNSELEFWQGLLNIGEETAVPVIEILKENINNNKNVIIDAPPGTTCPTIEAALDSDFCLLVTEPTPFGLNDLKMSVDVIKQLDIPFAVIINRAEDMYDQIIEDYCDNEGIEVIMKIPFSREIAELYSKGIPFVEKMVDWKDKFKNLYKKISSRDVVVNKELSIK
ncbi:MAG: P-loop NTPase [Halothermotrichaceae bacterium]